MVLLPAALLVKLTNGGNMWVDVEDIIIRWVGEDEPHPDEFPKVEVLIEDVEDEIIREFPGIADKVTSGAITLTTMKRVVYNVIRRVWSLGGNYLSSFQESFGPQSLGGSISGAQERGVYLTQTERDMLTPRRRTLRTLSTAPNMRVTTESAKRWRKNGVTYIDNDRC